MEVLQTRLTEPQLELLQMFAHPIDSTDWRNIKTLITEYFAKRAIEEANAVWDAQQWDINKVNELLNSHLRTPYQKP